MTEDLRGEAEGEQFVTIRVVEGTIVRERGTGEVVEDETKEFDGEMRGHFRGDLVKGDQTKRIESGCWRDCEQMVVSCQSCFRAFLEMQ